METNGIERGILSLTAVLERIALALEGQAITPKPVAQAPSVAVAPAPAPHVPLRTAPQAADTPPPAATSAASVVSKDECFKAISDTLAKHGMMKGREVVQDVLKQFSVVKLTQLDPERFGEFLTVLNAASKVKE